MAVLLAAGYSEAGGVLAVGYIQFPKDFLLRFWSFKNEGHSGRRNIGQLYLAEYLSKY